MTKLYFYGKYDKKPHTKGIIIKCMKDAGISSTEAYQAVICRDTDMFYCKKYNTAGEKGSCNRSCDYYSPRNNKSGICKHHGCMYEHGEKVIIKIK